MADSRLDFILSAKNLASGEFGAVKKDLASLKGGALDTGKSLGKEEGLGGKLGALGGFAAAAGIGIALGVGAALVEFAKKAQEGEVATARLTTSLQDNAKGWNGNTGAIDAQLESNLRLGFSMEDQKNALAGLVMATHNVKTAQSDLSLAMDLSRARGMDLAEASTLISKVQEGNVGVLKRYGIEVAKGATATQALGDIQKAVGGQSEAFAHTTDGAWAALGATAGHMEEQIGSAVLPLFADIANFLLDQVVPAIQMVVGNIGTWVAQNQGLIDVLRTIAGVVIDYLVWDFQMFASVAGTAFSIVSDAIGVTFGVIKTVVSAIIGAIKSVMDIAAGIPGPWQDAAKGVQAALGSAQQSVNTWGEASKKAVSDTGKALAPAAQTAMATIPDAATAQTAKAVAVVAKTPSQIAGALKSGYSTVQTAMTDLTDALKHPLTLAQREIQLKGELTGKALAAGLKSQDPLIRAEAASAKQAILDQMVALDNQAGVYGQNTMIGWAGGLNSPEAIAEIKRAARAAVASAKGVLQAFSPPGPESPLHEIDKWGENTMRGFADGVLRGAGTIAGAAKQAMSGVAPGIPAGAAVAGGHGHNIYMNGQLVGQLVDQGMYRQFVSSGQSVRGPLP